MKKNLLLFLSVVSALGASAYEVDFNSPINTSDLDFKVAPGWKHLVDRGGYASDIVHYTYKATDGVDDSGCLQAGAQTYFDYFEYEDIPLFDLLVTPLVSGNVSIDVKKVSAGGFIQFFTVAEVNGKLTRTGSIQIEDPELVTIDYTTFSLPEISEPTMIGIRASNVYLDDFYAENAFVTLEPSLTISNVTAGQQTGKIYCDAENNFTLSASVKVRNNGDVDLAVGEEGYCVKIVLMKKNDAGDYVVDRVVAEQPINQNLAVGETSDDIQIIAVISEASITAETGQNTKARRYDIQEGITNTLKSLGNYTPVPYIPIPVINSADGKPVNIDNGIDVGVVQGGSDYKITLLNDGAASLNVTGLTVSGLFFTIPEASPITLAANESAEIQLLFSSDLTGEQSGTITFNCSDFEDFSIAINGNLLDSSLWYVTFADGNFPPNMIAEGAWQVSNNLAYDDYDYYAVNNLTEGGQMLISPLLNVTDGNTLRFEAARNYGTTSFLSIYWSDDRENWTKVRTLSIDAENEEDTFSNEYNGYSWGTNTKYLFTPFSVNIPSGQHYIAFEAGNARVTNILGFTPVNVAHDIAFTNLNIPAVGMVNNEFSATVQVKNLNFEAEEEGSYTIALMTGDEVLAEAEAVEIPGYDSANFSFTFTPHDVQVSDLYVKISSGDYVCRSKDVEVSFIEELLIDEIQVGEVTDTSISKAAPLSLYYYKSQSENIYTAEQLGINAGNKITRISFRFKGYAKTITGTLTVRIENTDDNAPTEILLNEDQLNAMTTIYDGAYEYVVVNEFTDVISIDLNTPFEYTGSNLRVVLSSVSTQFATAYVELDSNIAGQSIYRAADGNHPTTFTACNLPVMYMSVSKEAPLFSGRVVDEEGAPVANAEVKLVSDNVVYSAVTDDDGQYSMLVVQYTREYNLTVTAENYVTYSSTVVFESSEDKTLDITLASSVTGVNDLLMDNEDEILYDINGMRINKKPTKGVYILRSGNKTRKVVL